MNKPIYLAMSILDISKTLMYKIWYDYIKPKYDDRAKQTLLMMLLNGLIHLTMMKMINDLFQ